MGLPQRHLTGFFCGGSPKSRGESKCHIFIVRLQNFEEQKPSETTFGKQMERKTKIRTFYHSVNSTAGKKHPPTKVGKPSSPSPLDSSRKTMKSHCSTNVSCGSLRPVLGRLPIALREASSGRHRRSFFKMSNPSETWLNSLISGFICFHIVWCWFRFCSYVRWCFSISMFLNNVCSCFSFLLICCRVKKRNLRFFRNLKALECPNTLSILSQRDLITHHLHQGRQKVETPSTCILCFGDTFDQPSPPF